MAVDWAGLPPELLRTIAEHLTSDAADYIRFRSVCVNWRSSSPRIPPNLPCQLPWLMLPLSRPHHTRRLGFFNLSANKIRSIDLPETSTPRCCGSSHGWLVFVDDSSSIYLLNPLTLAKLDLPPLTTFPDVVGFDLYAIGREYSIQNFDEGGIIRISAEGVRNCFLKKVILSANPSIDKDYTALAMLETGKIAFCRKGGKSWRYIEDAQYYCEDAIYHNKLFYALNSFGGIAVCDVHGPSPRVSVMETLCLDRGDINYLASHLDEELLLISRFMEYEYVDYEHDSGYKTRIFKVFRLDSSSRMWEQVTNLGNKMLFLGQNSTLALSSRDFPSCRGNCIYYTDDCSYSDYDCGHLYRDHDSGIFDMGNCSFEQLPCCLHNSYSPRVWPPPIWVTPYPF